METREIEKIKQFLFSDDEEMRELGYSIAEHLNVEELRVLHVYITNKKREVMNMGFYAWYKYYDVGAELEKREKTWTYGK